jgi:hypothetical protein
MLWIRYTPAPAIMGTRGQDGSYNANVDSLVCLHAVRRENVRVIDVFSPAEATCRECKWRWELATERTIDVRER